jgi:hypothetical protein
VIGPTITIFARKTKRSLSSGKIHRDWTRKWTSISLKAWILELRDQICPKSEYSNERGRAREREREREREKRNRTVDTVENLAVDEVGSGIGI